MIISRNIPESGSTVVFFFANTSNAKEDAITMETHGSPPPAIVMTTTPIAAMVIDAHWEVDKRSFKKITPKKTFIKGLM